MGIKSLRGCIRGVLLFGHLAAPPDPPLGQRAVIGFADAAALAVVGELISVAAFTDLN